MKKIIMLIIYVLFIFASEYNWDSHAEMKLEWHEHCCGGSGNYKNCKGNCKKSENIEECDIVMA